MSALLAFLALLIERAVGYPDALYRAIGHPVTWIGRLIAWADATLNSSDRSFGARRAAGILALVVFVLAAGATGLLVQAAFGAGVGIIATALVASSLIAQRSLASHVEAVADALEWDGLEGGRKAVSMIVGRDPENLDEAGVSRAAIESLSENFSDGVVAPAFWLAVAGLPGAAVYKAVNTADSMIGHATPRHLDFGMAAARLDDIAN